MTYRTTPSDEEPHSFRHADDGLPHTSIHSRSGGFVAVRPAWEQCSAVNMDHHFNMEYSQSSTSRLDVSRHRQEDELSNASSDAREGSEADLGFVDYFIKRSAEHCRGLNDVSAKFTTEIDNAPAGTLARSIVQQTLADVDELRHWFKVFQSLPKERRVPEGRLVSLGMNAVIVYMGVLAKLMEFDSGVPDELDRTKRLVEEMIELLKRFTQGGHVEPYDATCPICMEELKPDDKEVRVLPCAHPVHTTCAQDWLKLKGCPLCQLVDTTVYCNHARI
ncbi:hypothetical protein SeMB42_g02536 [Synchytrium endobioticum]|uniref:RING-type domain-containing protein n=1 Tax=Synchytrium endobioticum TaxID=286115 RepID=A0A507DED0_9FUNG|nr:hypothetical protein SeMB42_g02536 [Synchytrium endobioticum]